jgi:pyrophosphatase PpaX
MTAPVRPLALLFDLDGTLIDSVAFLLAAARYAFRERGDRAPTDAEWIAGIGTPLAAQLRPWCRDDDEISSLVAEYRAFQHANLSRETRCFPMIPETLRELRRRGHPTALVTSKGDEIARRSLDVVDLGALFDVVVGADSSARHKPDPEPVLAALDRLGCRPAEAIFVGDSPHDVRAGNAADVATAAVLWGPFSRADLAPARPTYWLERVEELLPLVERIENSRQRIA